MPYSDWYIYYNEFVYSNILVLFLILIRIKGNELYILKSQRVMVLRAPGIINKGWNNNQLINIELGL